jgi:hypothetical protein
MKREDLEHILRAAAGITNEDEFIIIGSQSILGAVPYPSEKLMESNEVDIYPLNNPGLADLIDGGIGEGSAFHETFTYYAQGVGPETAILPDGWQQRLIIIQNENTRSSKGLCLEPHDLAASKIVAGRDKDWAFVKEMIAQGVVQITILIERVKTLPITAEHKQSLIDWITATDKRSLQTNKDKKDNPNKQIEL